jgi:hypothetical protein
MRQEPGIVKILHNSSPPLTDKEVQHDEARGRKRDEEYAEK